MHTLSSPANDKRIKTCIARFDSHAYTRMQFLQAVSHSIGAHADSLCPQVDTNTDADDDDGMEDVSAATAAATAAPTAVDGNSAVAGACTSDASCKPADATSGRQLRSVSDRTEGPAHRTSRWYRAVTVVSAGGALTK